MASSTSRSHSRHTFTQSHQNNPYARMPSRRAIACVTCAKAKTKCNRALPSCSRCITKGIKCEPRSTRRTSDGNHRSNVKKPYRPPRRHYATDAVSRLDLHTQSLGPLSPQEPAITYAASYIDIESIAKSSRQDLSLSGYPKLTPLPSQGPQVFDSCYAYMDSPEHGLDVVFAQSVDTNDCVNLSASSPQTPSPVIRYEPASVLNDLDHYFYPESWSDQVHMPDEVSFKTSVTSTLPEMWATLDSTTMMSIAQVPWPLSNLSDLPRQMLDDPASHAARMASPTQYQVTNALDPVQPEWTFHGPTVTDMTMVTSAPFMYDLNLATSYAPIWEVPYIP